MTTYRLYWVTDLGYAGTDNKEHETLEHAIRAAAPGVTFKRSGQEWRSGRDSYGDLYIIRPEYR